MHHPATVDRWNVPPFDMWRLPATVTASCDNNGQGPKPGSLSVVQTERFDREQLSETGLSRTDLQNFAAAKRSTKKSASMV
jgi:hypothetical protein